MQRKNTFDKGKNFFITQKILRFLKLNLYLFQNKNVKLQKSSDNLIQKSPFVPVLC